MMTIRVMAIRKPGRKPPMKRPAMEILVIAPRTTILRQGGIIIPDTAKEKPQEGEIIAIGPGRIDDSGKRIPMDVKVGDVVIYAKYGGTEMKVDGEELVILREGDIFAKRLNNIYTTKTK
jgi:chaperonin GroES